MENPIRIVYTMFESTKIPDDWPDYLREADLVLVPSSWCQEVFAKSGVKSKVVPLGYNDTVFTYKERQNKRKAREPFTFLHYNAFNARKGFLELFKAFTQEFDPAEPVKLILKTTLEYIPSSFPINPRQYPNIEVITGATSDNELRDLLHRSDAFVFPSRGEGFAMPPIEAMATGLPVIVPNAHGITEYFDRDYMYEVNIKEMCPGIYSRYKDQDVGQMYLSDVDHLASQMRFIYEHQDDAIAKGKLAAEYVKRYTWKQTAKKLKEVLQEYHIKEPEQKQLKNVLTLEAVK
jgi:glycosyltransferase involved in cell wall biosynthesis